MMRTMLAAKQDNGAILVFGQSVRMTFGPAGLPAGFIPGQQVEAGFFLPFFPGGAVQEAIEQFRKRFGRAGTEEKDSARKMLIMIKLRFLNRADILDIARQGGWNGHPFFPVGDACIATAEPVQQGIGLHLQRSSAPRHRLEMQMIRRGSPAVRTVIEESIIREVVRQIRHVHEIVPNRLGDVLAPRNHQMLRENGIGVDGNVILLSLAAFEGDPVLLGRLFVGTEEAGTLDMFHLGHRRSNAVRIELERRFQAVHGQTAGTDLLKGTEPGSHFGPDGQLVGNEFDNLFFHIITRLARRNGIV